jgi:hypothetical protein
MSNSKNPDVVWECKDNEPLYPILFCAVVWRMQEENSPTFIMTDGIRFDPANYDARQLMSLAADMIALQGGMSQIIETDESEIDPETKTGNFTPGVVY